MSNPLRIDEIESLIIDNKLEEALGLLLLIFKERDDEEMINESILILSRLKNFLRKLNSGVTDYFDLEYSKIRLSVLQLKSTARIMAENKAYAPKSSHKKESYKTEETIFEDHFLDNANQWADEATENTNCYFKNNRYFLEHFRTEGCWFFYKEVTIDERNNFTLSSKITFLGGTETNGYGLIWGYSDPDNYFSFSVSANGYFVYSYYIEGKYVSVSGWKANASIKQGVNSNLLEIVKNNNIIHFKVNDEVVYTSDFHSFYGKKVGFILNQKMKVAVEYIKVKN